MNLSPEQTAAASAELVRRRAAELAARTRPKVAVFPADRAGCGYIRLIVPFKALRAAGHDVTFGDRILGPGGLRDNLSKGIDIFPLGTTWTSERGEPAEIIEPSVVVLQRQTDLDVLAAARALQERGAKIIFEFDDNFHDLPSANPNAKEVGTGKRQTVILEQYVAMADLVIVSTQALAEAYASYRPGKPIMVCENALDDAQFERFAPAMDGAPKREGQIRIGWAGSITHNADFAPLVKPLCKLMDEHPGVRLVFVGADMRPMFPAPYFQSRHLHSRNRVEFAGNTHDPGAFVSMDADRNDIAPIRYYDVIEQAQFDIALAPILPMSFNRSKSWIKLLEWGMLGIPAVASGFGPYRDYVDRAVVREPEGPVILASDPREWYFHLKRLVCDPKLRAALAWNNRLNVMQQHLISHELPRWAEAVDSLTAVPA